MPTSTFFANSLNFVDNVCRMFVGQNVVLVAQAIKPAVISFLGLYVILWGFASMRGMIKQPLFDMIERMVKLSLVLGVGIELAEYNVVITDLFVHGPDQLAELLARQPGSGKVVGGLDVLFSKGFTVGNRFWAKAGLLSGDGGLYFVALAAWAMTLIVTAYAFFLIVLSKVALAILLALGPLFIVSLLFDATAAYFNSWVRQLSNYFLIPVLVVTVNVLIVTLLQRAADTAIIVIGPTQIDQVFPFLAMSLVSLLSLASVLTLASGLAGGISLSSFGAGRLALGMASHYGSKAMKMPMMGAAKGAALGAQGGKKVARAGWNAYQNRKKNSIATES